MFKRSQAKVRKGRLAVLTVLITILWLALEINLFRVQILNHDLFASMANRQSSRSTILHADRGAICDRNGNKLADNTIYYDIAADPQMVRNKTKLAQLCSKVLRKPESWFNRKLNLSGRYTYLARRVAGRDIQPLLQLKERGLIRTKRFQREYPYRTYAAALLGFTDPDNHGLSGLEKQYDKQLSGIDGKAILQIDAARGQFFNADHPVQKPQPGNDIYLTIDKNIQTVVEQELARGAEISKAKAGMAVVLNPYSGAVLAMASYPSFNPNRQQEYKANSKRNRVIADVFEPGSTMKPITTAILLQKQLKKSDDIVYCEQGKYKLFNKYFRDTKKHGWLSLKKVITVSSNIGMIKMSDVLPSNTFFRYLLNFGFGSQTGIGLLGETGGILENPQKWSGLSKASLSIGYGVGVTAIQLVSAYAALINGGYLYQPYVVDHLQAADGSIVEANKPRMVRQVISHEVSDALRSFMLSVVEEGTGKKAAVRGLKVGGKTGTARKLDPKTHKYSDRKYTASFIGFAPYEHPQYVLAVIMDEPQKGHYGGQSAAPVFSRIIQRIINLENRNPMQQKHLNPDQEILVEKMSKLPQVKGFRPDIVAGLLEARDMEYKFSGKGGYVTQVTIDKDAVVLQLGDLTVHQDKVPRLLGLTLREALRKVDLSRFRIQLKGNTAGIVRNQEPPPGKTIKQRTALTLVCR